MHNSDHFILTVSFSQVTSFLAYKLSLRCASCISRINPFYFGLIPSWTLFSIQENMLRARNDHVRIRETYNCIMPSSLGRTRVLAIVDKMSSRALKDVAATLDCQQVRIHVDTSRSGENSFILLPFRSLVPSQPLRFVWIHDHRDQIEVSILFAKRLSGHNVVSVHNLINLGHQTIASELHEYRNQLRAESYTTVRSFRTPPVYIYQTICLCLTTNIALAHHPCQWLLLGQILTFWKITTPLSPSSPL